MKKQKLRSKVEQIEPTIEHEFDRVYFPICEFPGHPGIVLRESVCIERRCRYYGRYYFDREKSVYDGSGR